MRAVLVVGMVLAFGYVASADDISDCVAAMNKLLPINGPVKIKEDGRVTSMLNHGNTYATPGHLTETGADYEYTSQPTSPNDTAHTYKIVVEQPARRLPDSWNGPSHILMSKDSNTDEYYTTSPSRDCKITRVVRALKSSPDRAIVYDENFCYTMAALNPDDPASIKKFKTALKELKHNAGAPYGLFEKGDRESGGPFYRPVSDQDMNSAGITSVKDNCKLEAHELGRNHPDAKNTNHGQPKEPYTGEGKSI